MKLKNLGYVALMTVATTAFVLGTAGSSEAAKKKAEAAPPPVAPGVVEPAAAVDSSNVIRLSTQARRSPWHAMRSRLYSAILLQSSDG